MIHRIVLDALEGIIEHLSALRTKRRFRMLRAHGMRIGADTHIPASTWIDTAHSYLIAIDDNCRFGEQCLILSHDAQMDEFLDAGFLGPVTIHPWCQIGARTTILAGVEIGPRTIVTPGSVVSRSLPPDSVCGGCPARPLSALEDFLSDRQAEIEKLPHFQSELFDRMSSTPEGRTALAAALVNGGGYVLDDSTKSENITDSGSGS